VNIKIREEKRKSIDEIKKRFEKSQIVVLTNYRGEVKLPGLTVKEVTALRQKIRETGGEYKVFKNTLTGIALQEIGCKELGQYLVEPTAVIFGYNEPVDTAKAIVDFKKDADKQRKHLPVVKAIYMDGKVFKPEELDAISKLPPKKELLTVLLSLLESPLQNLVNVFSAPMRDLVTVLMAIKAKKEEEAGDNS